MIIAKQILKISNGLIRNRESMKYNGRMKQDKKKTSNYVQNNTQKTLD